MVKNILLALMLTTTVTQALAQRQPTADHAAEVVARIHDSMLNPPTFVLDEVYVTKANRRGQVSVCYEYRSQNAQGGMSSGRAVEDGADKGRLSTFTATGGEGQSVDDMRGYNAGWIAPCKAKNFDHEITKDVAAAAPALYRKAK
jgi:hypothetical protein